MTKTKRCEDCKHIMMTYDSGMRLACGPHTDVSKMRHEKDGTCQKYTRKWWKFWRPK